MRPMSGSLDLFTASSMIGIGFFVVNQNAWWYMNMMSNCSLHTCIRWPMRLGKKLRFFSCCVGVHGGGGVFCTLPGGTATITDELSSAAAAVSGAAEAAAAAAAAELVCREDPGIPCCTLPAIRGTSASLTLPLEASI